MRGLDDGQRAGLVLNECQVGLIGGGPIYNADLAAMSMERDIVSHMVPLVARFRELGWPVVHSTFAARPGYAGAIVNSYVLARQRKAGAMQEGDPATAIHPDLAPAPGDVVTRRSQGLTSFSGTELQQVLTAARVSTVVVVGVSTNLGVSGTVLEAVNLGFQTIVAEDATAGATPDTHEFMTTRFLPLLATMTTSKELLEALP